MYFHRWFCQKILQKREKIVAYEDLPGFAREMTYGAKKPAFSRN